MQFIGAVNYFLMFEVVSIHIDLINELKLAFAVGHDGRGVVVTDAHGVLALPVPVEPDGRDGDAGMKVIGRNGDGDTRDLSKGG
ncbi:MAG TPA: hypothetical protein VFD70_07760 [Anaerolineae bacterium]|nr:hypothetical protein [Anaerolineae bacterium]